MKNLIWSSGARHNASHLSSKITKFLLLSRDIRDRDNKDINIFG